MQKGKPSLNPLGRAAKPATTLRKAPGSDGVVSYSGYLQTSEKNPLLIGPNKWVTQDNVVANTAAVAAAVHVTLALIGSVRWSLRENPAGGADAKRCAELVHDGLLARRMTKPWRAVVRKQALKKLRGFALHAKGTVRDNQGRIVFSELAHRPQWTIERWLKPDETAPWVAVVQRTNSGKTFQIDRRDLFYSVDDSLPDSPDGLGLLRHLVDIAEMFKRFRQLQATAFDEDVNGIPVARAPLAKLYAEAKAQNLSDEDATAHVNAQTQFLRDLISNRVVEYGRSLTLDSIPYFSEEVTSSKRPSAVYEWSVDTIKSMIGSIPELRMALGDLNREMLRVLCAEWMAMGDSEGARAVHADKTQMYCAVWNSVLDDIADDGDRDLVWWLVARNGYDPVTCAPTLVHEPIQMRSAVEAAQVLELIAKAKLKPDDEAIAILRERVDLPAPPAPTEEEIKASRRVPPDPAVADEEDDEEEEDEE